jgi:hypothetical protein
MRLLVAQICILLVLVGCKKDDKDHKDDKPAVQKSSSAAVQPTQNEKTPPKAKIPAEIPGAKGSEPLPRDNRPVGTICMRACNKAQQCGSARGSVTNCVGSCQDALGAKDEDGRLMAQGFRAQDGCSSKLCAHFEECVRKALIGEKELAKNPAIAPDKAEKMCQDLCAQEERCHVEMAKRRGDIMNCLIACKGVLINPSPEFARNRALMTATHGCLNDDCKLVGQCVRASVLSK